MLSVTRDKTVAAHGRSMLEEVCGARARRMLAASLETEADADPAELVALVRVGARSQRCRLVEGSAEEEEVAG